jgi:hypothetical protein
LVLETRVTLSTGPRFYLAALASRGGQAVPPLGGGSWLRSLTAVQQSALLSILFFREINRFSFSLMHDDLAPFQKDVMQASLHLHPNDNVLEIGTMTHEGGMETYRFFGAPIAPPPTIGQNQADKKPWEQEMKEAIRRLAW